jgi:CBS domain containing-hemolysin-like protein
MSKEEIERLLIDKKFDFGDLYAKRIMTPFKNVEFVDLSLEGECF